MTSARPDAVNKDGQNAIMLAAEKGMVNLLRKLRRCGGLLTQMDKHTNTVLSYALQYEQKVMGNDIIEQRRKMYMKWFIFC